STKPTLYAPLLNIGKGNVPLLPLEAARTTLPEAAMDSASCWSPALSSALVPPASLKRRSSPMTAAPPLLAWSTSFAYQDRGHFCGRTCDALIDASSMTIIVMGSLDPCSRRAG